MKRKKNAKNIKQAYTVLHLLNWCHFRFFRFRSGPD